MKSMILKGLGLFVIGIIVFLLFNITKIKRLLAVNHLFDEKNIVDNFQRLEEVSPMTLINPAKSSKPIPKSINYTLPETFTYKDSTLKVKDYLEHVRTEGLMIIRHDTIIYESYSNGLTPEETHISWSLAKSFISTMVGMFVDRGEIDINTQVTDILPQFKETGYEGSTIEHLLQMSSGVAFNEDYGDFNSDINRFGRTFAIGGSFEKFAKSLVNERKPGTYNKYVSIDTQVLGMILCKISGKSLTELSQEMIWEPLGMEDDGAWVVDNTGMEMALGGLNATLRDYSKLGLLYLNKGMVGDERLLSEAWTQTATTPHAPHLMPNQTTHSNNPFGYGYQWWVPQFPMNDFFAVGIYNQFVYVNRDKNLVITKLSANHRFKTEGRETNKLHLALFQEIARTIDTSN